MGGAVNQNPLRGGSMRIVDAASGSPLTAYKVIDTPAARPTNYVEEPGVNHTDNGVYARFLNMTAANLSQPLVTAISSDARHFFVTVVDLGGAALDTTSVAAVLDNQGTNVPVQAAKQGITTTVTYNVFTDKGTVFAPGSAHQVLLTFSDNLNRSYTNSLSFTVPGYTTIPSSYAVTGVDTSAAGFSARIHQIRRTRSPGDPNTIAMAERQIADGFIDPSTGLAYTNMILPGTTGPAPTDPDGIHYVLDVINWNEFGTASTCNSVTPTNDAGDFQVSFGYPQDVRDTEIPGLYGCIDTPNPDAGGYNDNMVAEVIAYLDLPAGYYTFGVNSDDGFKVSVAPGIGGDVLGLTLGSFNGGRGSSDTLFDVYVPTSGIYPVRLLWWEGGGGANCEFFYVDLSTGQKVLINDSPAVQHWATGNPGGASAVKAYKGTATASVKRPYVSRVTPEAGKPEAANTGNGAQSGQLFVFADADVSAWITDGTITVNPSSVSLIVNGTTYTGATKSGNVTTISRPGSVTSLLPGGSNYAAVVYSYTDGGSTVAASNSWIFTVVPYTVIPAANAVPSSSLTLADTGFKALVSQIDRSGDTNQGNGARINGGSDSNRMPWPEVQLVGGNINPTNGSTYPNLVAGAVSNYDIPGALNFNGPSLLNPAVAPASGIFIGDTPMPGLPGTGTSPAPPATPGTTTLAQGTENYAAEFRTYLDLKAGAYVMAVNSDDGFVAISAPDPHDTLGTLLGFANFGRGNANPLPAPAATAQVPTPGTGNGNSTFQFVVTQDGIYPVRILYWQGSGGINIEFLSVDKASGLQALINGTETVATSTNVVPIKAYRTYIGSPRPWVRFSVSPTPWDNRHQQGGPGAGPMRMYGRTVSQINASDINNSANNTRPFADVLGAVIANGSGDPTLALLVNGSPVAATFTTNANDVTIRYKTPLPSGSTNTATLVYGRTSNSWSFIVQTYTNLNAGDALPESSADANARGFLVKMFQATNTQPNTVTRAENQIAGIITPNVALAGPGPNGSYIYTNVINWSNNRNGTNTGVEIGNFQTNANWTGWPYATYPDAPIPGIPGTGQAANYTDNIAAEIFAYWDFPAAGYYRLGVNSDDGFAIKVGTPGVTNGTAIASVDVGKGSSDIPVSVNVPQAGLYPIRLVYYNGGGGANLEFFSYDDTGKKIPINDRNDPTAIKAYYQVTTVTGPMFTSATVSGGTLTINWNAPSSGTLTLQQAAVVRGLPGDFSDVPGVVGTSYSVQVNAAAQKFYRLKQVP